MIKTSELLCMVLDIEGEIEASTIQYYFKELVKMGYVETIGTTMKLTDKGKRYIRNGKQQRKNAK